MQPGATPTGISMQMLIYLVIIMVVVFWYTYGILAHVPAIFLRGQAQVPPYPTWLNQQNQNSILTYVLSLIGINNIPLMPNATMSQSLAPTSAPTFLMDELTFIEDVQFNATTTRQVEWTRLFFCVEGNNNDFRWNPTNQTTREDTIKQANTIRIQPAGGTKVGPDYEDYAVTANPDSAPVEMLKQLKGISCHAGLQKSNYWIGKPVATARLDAGKECQDPSKSHEEQLYVAEYNSYGIHIKPADNECYWEGVGNNPLKGHNIEVYVGKIL